MTTPNAPETTALSSRLAALERMRASIDWRAALREFVTIVAGVLAALAAQAWWQAREQRAREANIFASCWPTRARTIAASIKRSRKTA
jgi:hypothetical protein